MGFPPGITNSGTRNPPEVHDSAGNNQLMEADSDRQDQNVRKILKAVTISGSASTNPIYSEGQIFKKFKYENVIKMKNKADPALLGGAYLFNEIKKGHQNLVRLSLYRVQNIENLALRYLHGTRQRKTSSSATSVAEPHHFAGAGATLFC
jgi:hypothetical protein